MVQFDLALFHAINGHAGVNAYLDYVVDFIARSDLLKGIPVMLLWWGLWFHRSDDQSRVRVGLIAVLICAITAIFVGRGLAIMLPFRLRPHHDPSVEAVLPIGASERTLTGWSSMPSDHAVLFFALAVSLLLLHRLIGYGLIMHAVVVIGLPRVFMGFHYPLDILVGAAVGTLIVVTLWRPVTALVEKSGILTAERRFGHLFYPALFLITYQAGTMFDGSRSLLSVVARGVRYLAG